MKHHRRLIGLSVAVLLLLATFAIASPARAAEFRSGNVVIIEAGEVVDDDLFASAERIEVHGVVTGDLFATGGIIVVDGEVEGSLIAAGQSIVLDGVVNGSVYGAGYALTLGEAAAVDRNLYFAGFSLETQAGSTIGRGLYMGGYQTLLGGAVARDVSVGTAALELSGSVGGDVTGQVSESDASFSMPFIPSFPGAVAVVAPGLRIGQEAQVGGEVGVEIVEVEVESPDIEVPTPERILGFLVWGALRRRIGEFLAVLILGGVLLYYMPALMRRASDEVQDQPLPSVGWGCLSTIIFAIAVPVAIGLLILLAVLGGVVTFGQLANDILGLGGAALAFVVTGFFTVIAVVTKAVVAVLIGRAILSRLVPSLGSGFWVDFANLALGMLIYELLRIIPLLGWVVAVVVTFVGLGALLLALRARRRAPEVQATLAA